MVSARLLTSDSSSPFTKLLGIVLSSPITIGTTVTFMFQSFFSSLARSKYSLFALFDFHSVVHRDTKDHCSAGFLFSFFFFFFFFVGRELLLGLVVWPGLDDLFVSSNPREFYASHSFLCIYHLVVRLNFNLFHNFQSIAFPTQSCLVLDSFSIIIIIILIWDFFIPALGGFRVTASIFKSPGLFFVF